MFKILALIIAVFVTGVLSEVYAQQPSAQAQTLAASLDKNKYKKKEKKNISIEIYIDIKNEPAVKSPGEYSGIYETDGYRLDLQAGTDGSATGGGYETSGWDNEPKRNFTLKDARIDGALLSGTKVFDDSSSERFEAVFVNSSVLSGKNAETIESRDTSFGVGFVQTGKDWTNRVFLPVRR